jgi:hypothetical protein
MISSYSRNLILSFYLLLGKPDFNIDTELTKTVETISKEVVLEGGCTGCTDSHCCSEL